ncbi:MAG: tRNA (guanosine(46)-N7)-methyltransferase TrmB [Clostridia bacterium]|nr:tRNA (guanosine(46)-N7)-methyltransferase TrmB [Clostridia bacterium]
MRMKKKKFANERLQLLGELLVTDFIGFIEDRDDIYDSIAPLRIEIGCGKGDFIKGKSVKEPDYCYLAIEKILDVCVLAVENYAKSRNMGDLASNGGWQTRDGVVHPLGSESIHFENEELGNVRFAVGDAKDLIRYLPDNSVDSIYINFCDPWSKKGHTKRRLTYIEFLKMYSRVLKPNGRLYFKTDNRPLFDFSLEEIEKSPFTLEYHTFDLHNSEMNSENIETEYERNFSAKGFSINMLIAKNNK